MDTEARESLLYDAAKAHRPLTLTSFFLKTTEKVLGRHLRDRIFVSRLLDPNQHAYQKGKSCDTAHHELVSKRDKL